MKVAVSIEQQGVKINETFEGRSADEIVGKMKARVSRELPFALRLAAGAMSNLMFAQEVVRRFNAAEKQNLPIPGSCEEFLRQAQEEGFAQMVEA